MNNSDVVARAFSMPLTSPSYPRGPYRFINREFLVITFRTDIDALRAVVPEPLQVIDPIVKFEFIHMPDSTGLGDHTESGPAGLELHAHALAPVADLPAREVLSAVHILTDLTLGLGEVVHDYLESTTTDRSA